MRTLELKGGPRDGWTVDLDRICNMSNVSCPAHGNGYYHGEHSNSGVVALEQHDYDMVTGEYTGKEKE